MSFDTKRCRAGIAWCGNGPVPATSKTADSYYTHKGSPQECLRLGVGVGLATERKKNLTPRSLQHIKYVGPVMEASFRKKRVATMGGLIKRVETMSRDDTRVFLKSVLVRSNGSLDKRAYNSVLLFLHRSGVGDLPSCIRT